MKILPPFLAIIALLVFSFAPSLARAQDDNTMQAPPPPQPGDQGAPPEQQGPPPDQGQGAPPPDQADQGGDPGVSFQQFYDQLGSQGTWVQTDDYGYVFQPAVSDPGWAPYSDGHWVNSDQGWVWVSDEPWGWATYHYGRWANIDGTGWVWVPGYRWAPAWVSWRYGGGYCGWAPLPPTTFIGAEFGGGGVWSTFHFGGDVDVSFGIGAGCYNFIRVGDFGNPNYRGAYLDRSRNYTVINNTTNITNININRNGGAGTGNFRGVSVGGPQLNEINAHSRERVSTVQLAAANQPGRSTLQGNTLSVYAPRVNGATAHQARPTQVSETIAHPTFNRGDSITRPLQVSRNVNAPAPTESAIQAAQAAQLHAPAKAKVATVNTTPRASFTRPLTSLAPITPTNRTMTTGQVNNFNNTRPATTPGVEHSTASSPFTGEPANHPTAQPATPYHPQTEERPATTPSVEHPAASSPFTGEPANHPPAQPATTFHPQTEEKPAPTYHPANNPPAQTFHPQTEEKPAQTYHPPAHENSAPAYHPQTEEKPAPTYHPSNNPAPANHPQAQPQNHPAPSGGGGGGGGGNHPAPSGGGGGGKPGGGNPNGH